MSNTDLCTILEWDTAFFDLRIARVCQDTLTIDEAHWVDRWCCDNNVACLYFLARADEPFTLRVAETHKFALTDIRVTYLAELVGPFFRDSVGSQSVIRPAKPADLPVLQRIARHGHTASRFYADERFPRHLCDALYETWITRSCTGHADLVLIAELQGAPIGYLTCHLDSEQRLGSIGLVGVDKPAQGQGVGQALVGEALKWFGAQQMRAVTLVTQGHNIAAQRLYQKNGFRTSSVQFWYHKWYADRR
jgi:dTDP-4-amino-4,6-dideoxy-D-galactose acyltransferase